jgi:hypothetical protein
MGRVLPHSEETAGVGRTGDESERPSEAQIRRVGALSFRESSKIVDRHVDIFIRVSGAALAAAKFQAPRSLSATVTVTSIF